MAYPRATDEDIRFFQQHGWIVVRDAIDPADLTELENHCEEILEHRDTMAFDWAWEKGTPREASQSAIMSATPSRASRGFSR